MSFYSLTREMANFRSLNNSPDPVNDYAERNNSVTFSVTVHHSESSVSTETMYFLNKSGYTSFGMSSNT